jgi:hypothetical protein
MIPELRRKFNANFSPEKYRAFLLGMDEECGTHIKFRNAETPCFYPKSLLDQMAGYGAELVHQLLGNPEYLAASGQAIPAPFNVPHETAHPEFVQVDFGLARNAAGDLEPKLVEIQGFPSLYGYQTVLARQYIRAYGLDERLKFILGDLDLEDYKVLLRRAILGGHDPRNVVLMEIDPEEQKTLPDFLVTGRWCGFETVNATEVIKEGGRLFYNHRGVRTPIHRIYNRVIADELERKGKRLPFSFRDELAVEWAGHPNWFFRISKFSLPYLQHPCVPRTRFLHQVDSVPADLSNYVLKPLYSFAGTGVIVGPTRENLDSIPEADRPGYILQERVDFAPVIDTPHGPTQAELRIMYIWVDELRPGPVLVRMGRGKMMGVDFNRDLEWVGSSAGLFLDD